MSGRGGRGGFRGGRGGGRGGSRTGIRELSDTGIVQYIGTPLFPEYTLPPFEHLTGKEEVAFEAWETLTYGMTESPYYLQEPKKKSDIARFTDQYILNSDLDRKSLSTTPAINLEFLPEELHQVKDGSKKKVSKRYVKKELDVDRIEMLARQAEPDDDEDKAGTPDDIDDEDEINFEDMEDEDDGDDYAEDYTGEDYDAAGGDEDEID